MRASLAALVLVVSGVGRISALGVGKSWPSATSEDEASRPIKQHIKAFSPEYNALTVNTNSDIDFASGAERMSARLSARLDQLASLVQQQLPGKTLRVAKTYEAPPPAGQASSSLHHEARAADLGLVSPTGAAIKVADLKLLGDLAISVRFDYVRLTTSSLLEVSVIPDKCTKKVDLAFLLDGSASIAPEDFDKAKDFVSEVTSFFDVSPTTTHVSVSTFSGFSGHISSLAGVPDCPRGTHFDVGGQGCICAPGSTCEGPRHSQEAGLVLTAGCRKGRLSSGGDIEYFDHGCDTCTCAGAQWANSDSVVTNFDFNDIAMSQQAVVSAMGAVEFPQGGTHTSLGLRHVRKSIFSTANGMRPAKDGVPRVLVVLTDGMANQGFAPKAEADLLKSEDNVKVFAIGVGNYNLQELRDMASQPAGDHIMLLQSFDEIVDIVNRMGAVSCDGSAVVDPDKETDTEVDLGSFLYFQPTECDDVAADVTVTLSGAAGSSTHLFMSWSEANPGPLNADRMDESADTVKVMVLQRAGHERDPIYLAVYGVGLTANQFTLKVSCDAPTTTTTAPPTTTATTAPPTTTAASSTTKGVETTTPAVIVGENQQAASGTTAAAKEAAAAPAGVIAGAIVGVIALIALIVLGVFFRNRGNHGVVSAFGVHDASMYNNPLYRKASAASGTVATSRDNLLAEGAAPAPVYAAAAATPPLPRVTPNAAYVASTAPTEEIYANLGEAGVVVGPSTPVYDSITGTPAYTPMSSIRYGNLSEGAEAPVYDTPSNAPSSSC